MKHSLPLTLLISLFTVAVNARSASAVEVYFNGVKVTGLRDQSFENCTVRFDASGNVYINAKGFSVKRISTDQYRPSSSKQSKPPPPARQGTGDRYYLYARATRPGYAQYDVDVYLNGKWIQKIRNGERQVVVEVTKHLTPGKNVVHFAATKNYGGKPRRSSSASDYVQVYVGLGTSGGGTVNITATLAEFKAAADRTDNFGHETTIKVK